MRRLSAFTSVLATALVVAGCGSSSSSSSSPPAGAASPTTSTAATTTATSSTASTSTGTSNAVNPPAPGKTGPEGISLETGPVLAPASSTTAGTTVDGIQCAPLEQLAYHIHAHLQVFVDGQSRTLPPAIGMIGPVAQQTPEGPFYSAQKCIYWLHTHAGDGIIHIESPTKRIYTLGNFFDEWHQPLSATQVASDKGKVTAMLNGKPWTKNIRDIPLNPHAQVQLDIGRPTVRFEPISFGNSGL
jgi:hypothetical protein